MRGCGKVKILVSEEEEEAIIFPGNGKYAVVCDPIDGSSNLDAGVSVGTIFGVFRLADGSEGRPEEVCQPGTELVASGFTMYGASAQLVLTMKGGNVNGFTLDNALGEFILTHPNVCPPPFTPSSWERSNMKTDADTQVSLYLFRQRGKLCVLGRRLSRILRQHQVPQYSRGKTLLRSIHRIHGGRCLPYPLLRWNLCLPRRQEVEEGKAEDSLRMCSHGYGYGEWLVALPISRDDLALIAWQLVVSPSRAIKSACWRLCLSTSTTGQESLWDRTMRSRRSVRFTRSTVLLPNDLRPGRRTTKDGRGLEFWLLVFRMYFMIRQII